MKPFKKAILIIIVIAVTACAVFGIYNIAYADKVLSGVTAAGIDISGKSETEAAEILQKAINKFQNESIVLQSGNKQWFATPRELGINFYAQTTAKRAFEIGRSNPWHKDLITRAKTIVMDHEIDMVFSIDEISLEKYADKHFGELETSAKNANLKISDNKILKTKEKNGVITNEKDFFKKTRESAEKLNKDPIQISFTTSYPVISEQDTEMAASAAKKIMQNGVKLKHGDKTWEISKGDAVEMISFTPRSKSGHEISKEDLFSKEEGKDNRDITLGLELLGSKLDETLGKISEEIKTDPINAHFEIVDESSLKIPLEGEKPKDTIRDVVLSEPSKNGGKLNKDESFKKIRDEINDGQTMVDLVVDKKEPQVTEKNYKEVGIKKLIGRGESSWSGSPANRIHNIKVAAAELDGTVIRPGTTFSFGEWLGPVTEEAGYKKELVIKNKSTVPDIGGGVCQVSTTTFRAAVDAGLPITERKAHSYAVPYYNPQGTDAAYYTGSVDLKFANDTPGMILIQTEAKQHELIFNFLGTDDGRIIEKTKPITYDRKGNGAMKAEWGYKVTLNGTVMTEDVLKSNYKPPSEYHQEAEEKIKKEEEEQKNKKEDAKKDPAKKKEDELKKKAGKQN